MNPRKPILALVACGLIAAGVLTSIPYTLTLAKRAGHDVADAVQTTLAAGPTPTLAELPPPPALAFDVALWYGSRVEEPERQGVLVQTTEVRQVFASHNADTTFNPASLIKLATSLVALRHLGPEFRFETSVYADGIVDKAGTLAGSVYLVGNDPSFTDYGAHRVAEELRARGVKRVRDRVAVAPGFSFNYSESAEDSAKFAASVMKLRQKETGVEGQPRGQLWFTLRSNPLREILLYMNAHSINFVADRLGNYLGGPAEVTRFLVQELKLPPDQVRLETCSGLYNNRMTPRGLIAVVRALGEELSRHGLRPEDVLPVVGSDWGTLRRRLEGSGLEGSAVGKTGTLTTTDGGMSNLAGVVFTQDAGPVLFVIMAQGNRIWEHKQMADQLLAEVLRGHQPAPLMAANARRQLLPPDNLLVEPGTEAAEHETVGHKVKATARASTN